MDYMYMYLNLHFLEEVSVGDHLQFLQDQVDPEVNEESFIFLQSFREQQKIALATRVWVNW